MMKKILLFLSILISLCNPCNARSIMPALELTIKLDKEIYKPGDTIEISYTIENISTLPVGFYVKQTGDLQLRAFDISGNSLEYYYSPHVQRMMPLLYPDEYVFLEPNKKWERKAKLTFKQGKIEEFLYIRNKMNPGKAIIIHDGLYIDAPGSLKYDHILIPADFGGEIKLVLKYFTNNPNPKNFTEKQCKDLGLSMDLFPDEILTNKISHSTVVVSQKELEDYEPPDENKGHLVFYCQHRSILSKKAWEGILQSNEIVIKIQQ